MSTGARPWYMRLHGHSRYVSLHRRPLVVWLAIGGRKPLAHFPRWRRHLFHLPGVRVRLWPPLLVQVNGHVCGFNLHPFRQEVERGD